MEKWVTKPIVSKFRPDLSARLKDIAKKQVPAKLKPIVANGSLTKHQISAQSVNPFPRYRKGTHLHMRTCARADVPHS